MTNNSPLVEQSTIDAILDSVFCKQYLRDMPIQIDDDIRQALQLFAIDNTAHTFVTSLDAPVKTAKEVNNVFSDQVVGNQLVGIDADTCAKIANSIITTVLKSIFHDNVTLYNYPDDPNNTSKIKNHLTLEGKENTEYQRNTINSFWNSTSALRLFLTSMLRLYARVNQIYLNLKGTEKKEENYIGYKFSKIKPEIIRIMKVNSFPCFLTAIRKEICIVASALAIVVSRNQIDRWCKRKDNDPTPIFTNFVKNILSSIEDMINKDDADELVAKRASSQIVNTDQPGKMKKSKIDGHEILISCGGILHAIYLVITIKKDDNGKRIEIRVDNLGKGVEHHPSTPFFLLPELPKELSKYRGSYILVDKKVLYFVKNNNSLEVETVKINDFSKFLQKMQEMNESNKDQSKKLFLSEAQVKELITANGGYISKMTDAYPCPISTINFCAGEGNKNKIDPRYIEALKEYLVNILKENNTSSAIDCIYCLNGIKKLPPSKVNVEEEFVAMPKQIRDNCVSISYEAGLQERLIKSGVLQPTAHELLQLENIISLAQNNKKFNTPFISQKQQHELYQEIATYLHSHLSSRNRSQDDSSVSYHYPYFSWVNTRSWDDLATVWKKDVLTMARVMHTILAESASKPEKSSGAKTNTGNRDCVSVSQNTSDRRVTSEASKVRDVLVGSEKISGQCSGG